MRAPKVATQARIGLVKTAKARHLESVVEFSDRDLLSVGDKTRLQGWEPMLQSRVRTAEGLGASEEAMRPHHHLVTVARSVSFMALPSQVVAPAVLRRSRLFSLFCDRFVHPLELLAIQGFPILTDSPYSLYNPFKGALLQGPEAVTSSEIEVLAGNSMHLAAVGGVLLLVLAST